MKFFIKQYATYPILKFPLTQRIMEKYDITDEMMENVAVTFSMIDENGNFYIANYEADLNLSEVRYEDPDEVKYTLIYNFSKFDTTYPGQYRGEFKLDFLLDGCSIGITLPVDDYINIRIFGSITKTDVL